MESIRALPLADHRDVENDECALVEVARANPAAFGQLYQRYLTRVYRYLRARTDCQEDAADLTQQVFLQALDALPRYRPRGVPFAAWLFRIARNAATDHHRRRRTALPLELLPEWAPPADEGDPEATVLRQEEVARVQTLLGRLELGKRELLALRFDAGLTAREIACVVGGSEAAIQRQLGRTLQILKEQYRHGER